MNKSQFRLLLYCEARGFFMLIAGMVSEGFTGTDNGNEWM